MKLIIGLGNFPEEYNNTKHNVGFKVIDEYCKKNNITLNEEKFNGKFYKGDNFIIAKPYTYMNNSGEFVKSIVNFYKININDVLIIYDDIDTVLGKYRIKKNGSSGGQNGMKSIINYLNSENIKRIKIGTGPFDRTKKDLANFVMEKFTNEENSILNNLIHKNIIDIIDSFINDINFEVIISKY